MVYIHPSWKTPYPDFCPDEGCPHHGTPHYCNVPPFNAIVDCAGPPAYTPSEGYRIGYCPCENCQKNNEVGPRLRRPYWLLAESGDHSASVRMF